MQWIKSLHFNQTYNGSKYSQPSITHRKTFKNYLLRMKEGSSNEMKEGSKMSEMKEGSKK